MKNTLFLLTLLFGGSLFLPIGQANEWPYNQSGFNQTNEMEDENEDEDGYPPEGESMPGMDEDEDDESFNSGEDEDEDFNDEYDGSDNSTWLDSDDE